MPIPSLASLFADRPPAADSPRLRRLLPYLLVLLVFVLVMACGEKFWDANDDEHMAMLAQGYGLAGAPSPMLVFSNVVWGWLMVALGAPFGIPGYTVGTYLLMLASATALAWVMLKRGTPGLLAAALLLAMFIRPLLEPQFTITAGYAGVAGMALLVSCEYSPRWSTAAWAGLFLVLAAWIRLQELLFVGFVSAPFLLHALYRNRRTPALRPMLAAILVAAAVVGGCKLLDTHYRSGSEWQRFDQMNSLRRPFTDYGLGPYFENQKKRAERAGLSRNDLSLLDDWFFLDDRVYNDDSLGTLLRNLTWSERLQFNLRMYASLSRPFTSPLVVLLGAAALLAFAFSGRRRVALLGIALFALSMFIFLCLGRPGVPRVFPGAVAALALMMMLDDKHGRRAWAAMAVTMLLGVVCLDGANFFVAHRAQDAQARSVMQDMCQLPGRDQLQVVWGAPRGFVDRYVYGPTRSPTDDCLPHIYLVGVLELLPVSLQQLHAYTGGKDLVPALLAGQRFYFLSTEDRLAELDRYLHEHYGVGLHVEPSFDRDSMTQFRVWVEAAKAPAS